MNRNKYAVVKFKSYSSYSEIPTAWLIISDDDNNKYQQCWWPPRTTNSALAIANCANPNPNTWSRFEVEFIKYCSSYETARKSAADSNYETTDEERLGRGKRSHVPHNPYESDEEDDINQQTRKTYCKKKQSKSCILPALPPCPDTFGSVRKSFDMPPNNNKASYKSAQKSAADANYETDKEQLSREKRSHMNRFESDEEENNDQQNQNNYASYKSAQKSAADANNETDEEQLSRGKRSHVNRFESDEEENNNQQTQNNYGKSMYNIERQSNSSVFSAGQSCSNTSGSFDMSRHNNKDSDKENNLRRVQSSKKSCHRNSPDSPTASSRELLILTDAEIASSVAKYESLHKNTDENNRPISPSMLFTPKKRVKRLAFYPVNLDNTENKPLEQKVLLDKFNIKRKEKRKDISEQRNMRCKAERAKLNGWDCWECREYYKMLSLSKEDLQKRKNQCSRHRSKYERPNTPQGFWDLEFPETLSDF
ncbi:uncharacterized protein [Temnothorax nylanderi]|uniref:uncharacterized protein isoform X2 n=1 Tax=Temnothorax nylanderi TaxID=102681 RepID=UPI003A8B2E12